MGWSGKCPGKYGSLIGDVLEGGDVVALNLQHAVHHQERIAMRKNLHHLFRIQGAALRHLLQQNVLLLVLRPLAGGAGGGPNACAMRNGLFIWVDDLPDELAIGRVAGFDRDQMPADRPAEQRQVAHDVEHLVPHEFLGITQRLGRQHGVVANDHRVFQAAALDQAVLDEILDLLVKTKRPRMGQFLFPRLGRDFRAVKLGEPALSCPRWCR